MNYDPELAIALLERTPGVLRQMLLDLPSEWLDAPEGPGAWSAREVASHLADLERDGWIPRVRVILAHGAETELPAIQRERFRSTYSQVPLVQVLDDFTEARGENLDTLRGLDLSRETLEKKGLHGAFGDVRLSQLLSAWVVHDLTHLAQVSRAIAIQYREAVGPWREFLSILRPRT